MVQSHSAIKSQRVFFAKIIPLFICGPLHYCGVAALLSERSSNKIPPIFIFLLK